MMPGLQGKMASSFLALLIYHNYYSHNDVFFFCHTIQVIRRVISHT
jgi:hypothetical protein